ncbi:MAG TPA: amino acid ABC transporter permease, partial [Ruminococcaceae bacterium]|nr:amino acid ABC transporter permease [Oscillospiraceae bacterium]
MAVFFKVFSPSNLNFMLQGVGMLLAVASVSIVLSLLLGTLLGTVKAYGPQLPRAAVSVYIEIFRT